MAESWVTGNFFGDIALAIFLGLFVIAILCILDFLRDAVREYRKTNGWFVVVEGPDKQFRYSRLIYGRNRWRARRCRRGHRVIHAGRTSVWGPEPGIVMIRIPSP
jgi:hypothetical protein